MGLRELLRQLAWEEGKRGINPLRPTEGCSQLSTYSQTSISPNILPDLNFTIFLKYVQLSRLLLLHSLLPFPKSFKANNKSPSGPTRSHGIGAPASAPHEVGLPVPSPTIADGSQLQSSSHTPHPTPRSTPVRTVSPELSLAEVLARDQWTKKSRARGNHIFLKEHEDSEIGNRKKDEISGIGRWGSSWLCWGFLLLLYIVLIISFYINRQR